MKRYDAVVIGGGLLGCFAARELTRYELRVALIEAREDVCTGVSKANTAIVYAGCDHKPGTLKARLTLEANRDFDRLCKELGVRFHRCGTLQLSGGGHGDAALRKKLERGLSMGVPGLQLLSASEARERERALGSNVRSALWIPTAGIVDAWELCYGAFENAVANGCDRLLHTEVTSIERCDGGYVLHTDGGDIRSKAVVNCAGLYADKVHAMLFEPGVRIVTDASDCVILERDSVTLDHIIEAEAEGGGKAWSAVPTVGGSVLLESDRRDIDGEPSAASAENIRRLRAASEAMLPSFREGRMIRSFAAVRPNPYRNGESIGSFVIEKPEPGFMSFIGIKTPGLTCAAGLGQIAADAVSSYLGAALRTDFDAERKAPIRVRELDGEARAALIAADPDAGEQLCLCEDITKAEVLDAIRRGAVTLDGVKRRCGVMLGDCQGSRCQQRVAELLSRERGISVNDVTKSGGASYVTGGRHG